WVDGDKRYSRFVEGLGAGAVEFPYPVVAFRGSFLELMLALKAYGNGLRREHVLVHLGGLTKESVKETPVLELYRAGTVFEKSLGTLVREASVGRARPDEVEDFLGGGGVTLEAADAWLASLQAVPRDGLTLELESLGVEGVVMRLIEGKDGFAAHLPEGHEELLAYLEKNLGLTSSFRRFVVEGEHLDREKAARLVASWLMAVEFVHDLRAAPVTEELRAMRELGPFAKECRRLVARLRERLPEDYEYFAAQLQERLQAEREAHAAEVRGATDTFRVAGPGCASACRRTSSSERRSARMGGRRSARRTRRRCSGRRRPSASRRPPSARRRCRRCAEASGTPRGPSPGSAPRSSRSGCGARPPCSGPGSSCASPRARGGPSKRVGGRCSAAPPWRRPSSATWPGSPPSIGSTACSSSGRTPCPRISRTTTRCTRCAALSGGPIGGGPTRRTAPSSTCARR